MIPELLYYKLHKEVKDPVIKTNGSICFDIFYFFEPNKNEYTLKNGMVLQRNQDKFKLNREDTYLFPTGLIFDIPKGFHLKLHERSSTCLKEPTLQLANNVGIIDSDYREEILIPVRLRFREEFCNYVEIDQKSPLFQIEFCKNQEFILSETHTKPQRVTERNGGFGSTG